MLKINIINNFFVKWYDRRKNVKINVKQRSKCIEIGQEMYTKGEKKKYRTKRNR